jgi:spore germination protein GerM
MTARRAVAVALITPAIIALVWALLVGLPGWVGRAPSSEAPAPATPATEAAPERKIKARLFYVADDGRTLASVEQDVTFAERAVDQAKAIVTAQLAPVAEPLVSAIPAGTTLRALFITEGEAYVDLSRELAANHPGGSMYERLTVETIVAALVANLPAVTSVQLLVDGKELDTLAGHVNLSRPMVPNDAIRQPPGRPAP